MACGKRCIQSLNVLSTPLIGVDTDTVDVTISGANISADVKVDPDVCNDITSSASGLKVVEHTTVSLQQDYPPVSLTTVGDNTFIEMTVTNPSSCRSLVGMFFINEHAAWQDGGTLAAGLGATTLPVRVLLDGIQQNYVTSNYYPSGTASHNNSSGVAFNGVTTYRLSRIDVGNGVKMVPVTLAPGVSTVIRVYSELPLPSGGLSTTTVVWQDLQIAFMGGTI